MAVRGPGGSVRALAYDPRNRIFSIRKRGKTTPAILGSSGQIRCRQGNCHSVKDLAHKLMRYNRLYNREPRSIKWRYPSPSQRIGNRVLSIQWVRCTSNVEH
jgi:hypothetical protein